MDFRLDDGQRALQETVARFCADHFGLERTAASEGEPTDRAVWREMGELGIFNLMVPESSGGIGLGAVEGAIVFEQLGRHLVHGPALWCTLAAPLVDGAGSGGVLVSGLEAPGATGDPILVEHASELDTLVMVGPDRILRWDRAELPPAVTRPALDPLTPVGQFAALPGGTTIGSGSDAEKVRLLGVVLCAAMLLGVSDAALAVARDYALEREQFGVPIGSFQALKHIMADMFVRTGLARSATYAAAAASDDPDVGDPLRAGSAAKILAGQAALENARAAIQVLGGMGFTWHMPPHYLLKRAWVLEHSFGTADAHALALASSVEAEAP